MPLLPFLHRAAAGAHLDPAAAEQAMDIILDGDASTAQIAAFLVALRMKGETSGELLGFARAMRARAHKIRPDIDGEPLVDTCGTGGDGRNTFNISTIGAFVLAGAGVKVAKHGNRSISSKCGSADLLERLGVQVVSDAHTTERAIREIGIAFLFAPAFHPAMKHAQPARLELKMRTVFNLLGPLANPAGATVQLIGAPSEQAAELMAGALAALGLERGFVVHRSDGLDEITTSGPTAAFEIREGRYERRTLTPEDFGVPRARSEDFAGGTPEQNCEIALAILNGERGSRRDIVLVNASAAFVAAGKVANFREGVELAAHCSDSGAALQKARELAAFTSKNPSKNRSA